MCGTISITLTPGMMRQEDDDCVVSLGDRETPIQNNDKNSKQTKMAGDGSSRGRRGGVPCSDGTCSVVKTGTHSSLSRRCHSLRE